MENSLYTAMMQSHLQAVEEMLPKYLPSGDTALQKSVFSAMEYACEAGGKRLRPVLVMEFNRICGGDGMTALPFACAIEMIHSYSLVHDDLPCMDNSPLRRGRPSAHAAFGEDIALLAGDGLLNRAFEVMLNPEYQNGIPPQNAMHAAYSLADASGAFGMVGGQAIDLQSEGKDADLKTLEELQRKKTAALIIAACEMGCFTAGEYGEKLKAARKFGEQLGLSFQIVDDILDVTASSEELGKPTGSDDENHKVTYVSLLGLEEAKKLAAVRTEKAIEALSCFGGDADGLHNLAKALLYRKK